MIGIRLIDDLKFPGFIIDRNFVVISYKNIPIYILQDAIKKNNSLKKKLEEMFVSVKIIDIKYIIDYLDKDE